MISLTLSFNEVKFNPVQHDQQIWLTASELAKALGYEKSNAVTQIYERNKDEFTSDMTTTLKLSVVNSNYPVENLKLRFSKKDENLEKTIRIFSLRGCHLITFFARTKVAKEFRKWVLDVLEKEVMQQQIDTRVKINAEQQAELKEIVDRRAQGERRLHAEMWARHNRHFRITRYSDLLAIHFQDAVNYLETLEIKTKGEIQIDDNQSIETLCIHAKLFQAWWKTHSPTLGKLNPTLESMLHDNMFYMTTAIKDLCKKYDLKLPDYDYEHMFELNKLPHQRYLLLK
ncbi:BRO family protein [Acinetobacter sp. 251-1]|uniref:BRO-N domain-containing protein n=1 Tax=Acinetobacter sp. 251-1 TaxID=2746720 RepID=UPI0025783F08|nr:BRO family protein [Acinetobacter sp. 251-1]